VQRNKKEKTTAKKKIIEQENQKTESIESFGSVLVFHKQREIRPSG